MMATAKLRKDGKYMCKEKPMIDTARVCSLRYSNGLKIIRQWLLISTRFGRSLHILISILLFFGEGPLDHF